ncbi:hypothetical protein M408DRAFT_331496 [Serendipita vermifera MAFF 305830]|uniref:Uncharacterized protein n=1 Tax=Serendipita vermifera MAFF 305830 TaxID=933852 RepID=A0A0C3B0H7_SERVB|nr:hypothetical protein M408DRAFT_331496 [Serendipita vermifera MAFF 305830]
MPFAHADIYSATLSDYEHDERRPGQQRPSESLKIHSSQFFTLALLLFVATAIQEYHRPATSTLPDPSVVLSVTRYAVHAVSDVLSPLMLLSCAVAAAGTLCRGVELVINASMHAAR